MLREFGFDEWLMLQDAPEFWINREDYMEEGINCLNKMGQS